MPKELSPALLALRAVPDRVLFKTGTNIPNYNLAFSEVCRELYVGHLKSAKDLIEAIGSGKQLNLSSWQRMVSLEARRRRPKIK